MDEHLLGRFGPTEGRRVLIPIAQIVVQRLVQGLDAGEAAPPHSLACQDREESSTRFSQEAEVGVKWSW
jgi:hypothetical protein